MYLILQVQMCNSKKHRRSREFVVMIAAFLKDDF